MARIVSVYTERPHRLVNMSYIRWYRMAEALTRLGHQVDIAVGSSENGSTSRRSWPEALRTVPLSGIDWTQYDAVKVSYLEGWSTLKKYGGEKHPFIIARMGTVVDSRNLPGIVFRGSQRRKRHGAQLEAVRKARYISVLNDNAKKMMTRCGVRKDQVLVVPGAAEHEIPPPSADPYPDTGACRCLFAGNLLSPKWARKAHTQLSMKLNQLGASLKKSGVDLYVLGSGDPSLLDSAYVRFLGAVECEDAWNYMHHAHVGVELVKSGQSMLNNESSKLYCYLRVGLPVVTEEGLPNAFLVRDAGCGFVAENGDIDQTATSIKACATMSWDRSKAIEYILANHTWEGRAAVYRKYLESA